MYTQKSLLMVSLLATATLQPLRLANFAGALCGAGVRALGVPEHAAVAGDLVAVATHGELVVEAGDAVAVGAQVQSDATGRVITLDAGVPFGVARDAAAAAGDYIRVLV